MGRYLKKTAPSLKQAKVELTKLQKSVDERRHPRSAITVSQAIEQWLEVTSHEASTRERYEQLIRLYIAPTLGKVQLARVEAETLESPVRAADPLKIRTMGLSVCQ
ncbi:MAG TPA: hypothetical protein VHV82_18265 [Sporichthyaceae bacterium]|jgi:hypothetical protein|nr:hypothetical protein [Sporichthyaceae bacterium]